eukprot:2372514-Prymnesium_polylepis.1
MVRFKTGGDAVNYASTLRIQTLYDFDLAVPWQLWLAAQRGCREALCDVRGEILEEIHPTAERIWDHGCVDLGGLSQPSALVRSVVEVARKVASEGLAAPLLRSQKNKLTFADAVDCDADACLIVEYWRPRAKVLAAPLTAPRIHEDIEPIAINGGPLQEVDGLMGLQMLVSQKCVACQFADERSSTRL